MTGLKIDRWKVISFAGIKNRRAYWLCECECGNQSEILGSNLRNGNSKSCGCLKHDLNILRSTKHNLSRSRIYQIWADMKQRCYNAKEIEYIRYGARGITVCDEWINSFEKFNTWAMANGYREDLTIDKIDNYKGYSPDNCRWITIREQGANRRNNIIYTVDGSTDILSNLCRKYNKQKDTVRSRLKRGIPIELALKEPLHMGVKLQYRAM